MAQLDNLFLTKLSIAAEPLIQRAITEIYKVIETVGAQSTAFSRELTYAGHAIKRLESSLFIYRFE